LTHTVKCTNSLTALPRSPSWFKGALLLRVGERLEKGRKWAGRESRERKGEDRGMERKGRGGKRMGWNTTAFDSCVRPCTLT